MRRKRNQKGFTLMELMVVIVIVAILAAVAVPLYINYVKDARRTEAKAAVGALATAEEEYYLNNNTYADAIAGKLIVAAGEKKQTNLSQDTVDQIEQNWDITFDSADDNGYAITLAGGGKKKTDAYTKLGKVHFGFKRNEGGTITEEP